MKSVRPTLEELMHSPDHYHGKASDHAESAVRHDDVKGINIKNVCPLGVPSTLNLRSECNFC